MYIHITYAFFETNEACQNLRYFLHEGLNENCLMTLIVKDPNGIKNENLRKLVDENVKNSRVTVINIENIGYDFRGYLESLNLVDFDKFDYFILMNAGCIGPFYRGEGNWYDVFIEKITDKIKVVGTNVCMINGPGRKYKGSINIYNRHPNLSWGGWFCFADKIGIKILHTEYQKYNIETFKDAHALECINGTIVRKAGYDFTGLQVKRWNGLSCETKDPYKAIIFKRKYNRRLYKKCTNIILSLNIDWPSSIIMLKQIGEYYSDYNQYINHQKEKTIDPKKRETWLGKEWKLKIDIFKDIFLYYKQTDILKDNMKCLCMGARTGQEVVALNELGMDAIGIDLVPQKPYVIEGDVHNICFADNTFDFVFTNIFGHSIHPLKFVNEIERVLKPGAHALIHLGIYLNDSEYNVLEFYKSQAVIDLFNISTVLINRKIKSILSSNCEVVVKKI